MLAHLCSEGQTVRERICNNPEWAFNYAYDVDCGPGDDTREATEDPEFDCLYALWMDKAATQA